MRRTQKCDATGVKVWNYFFFFAFFFVAFFAFFAMVWLLC